MAAFNNFKQKMVPLVGLRMETGSGITIAGVSGQTLTIATKLRKVISGFGFSDTDGLVCIVSPGLTSGGQATFKRIGNIETSADTLSYQLFGH